MFSILPSTATCYGQSASETPILQPALQWQGASIELVVPQVRWTGKPVLVHNPLTLKTAPDIVATRPEAYVMAPMAETMLEEDPELRMRFEQKPKEDEAFARSPADRLNWFYKQTPFFDKQWRLYPVAREKRVISREVRQIQSIK